MGKRGERESAGKKGGGMCVGEGWGRESEGGKEEGRSSEGEVVWGET